MIRKAEPEDVSRIAEISVFAKRVNYRRIFHNDLVSFGQMQVYPLAKEYLDEPEKLNHIWVYDDEFVKGFIHLEGKEIRELYVDPFFVNEGIGSKLLAFAVEKGCDNLWLLAKNEDAKRFYLRHGFKESGRLQNEANSTEIIIEMIREDEQISDYK